jgi:hypothetical protein
MRFRYAVSFESDLQPVRTDRGELSVANASLGARRAVEAARRAFPGSRWRSLVVVLEKLDSPEDEGPEAQESTRLAEESTRLGERASASAGCLENRERRDK